MNNQQKEKRYIRMLSVVTILVLIAGVTAIIILFMYFSKAPIEQVSNDENNIVSFPLSHPLSSPVSFVI